MKKTVSFFLMVVLLLSSVPVLAGLAIRHDEVANKIFKAFEDAGILVGEKTHTSFPLKETDEIRHEYATSTGFMIVINYPNSSVLTPSAYAMLVAYDAGYAIKKAEEAILTMMQAVTDIDAETASEILEFLLSTGHINMKNNDEAKILLKGFEYSLAYGGTIGYIFIIQDTSLGE